MSKLDHPEKIKIRVVSDGEMWWLKLLKGPTGAVTIGRYYKHANGFHTVGTDEMFKTSEVQVISKVLEPGASVFVVMGNDYPSNVFSNDEKAAEVVEKLKKFNGDDMNKRGRSKIYWRSYAFVLDREIES